MWPLQAGYLIFVMADAAALRTAGLLSLAADSRAGRAVAAPRPSSPRAVAASMRTNSRLFLSAADKIGRAALVNSSLGGPIFRMAHTEISRSSSSFD